jgi:hypothetical protein
MTEELRLAREAKQTLADRKTFAERAIDILYQDYENRMDLLLRLRSLKLSIKLDHLYPLKQMKSVIYSLKELQVAVLIQMTLFNARLI